MLKIIFSGLVFIFGLQIGSFLNCVIYRLKEQKSFLQGRSFCPKCNKALQWNDLIPVLSFAFLKGRCRHCQNKISWQYPLVEIATGLLFLLIFNLYPGVFLANFKPSSMIELLYLFIIASLLLIIFVYDLKYYLIPSGVVYLAVGIVFVYRLSKILAFDHWKISSFGPQVLGSLQTPLIAGILAGAFFFLLWFISRGKWMGFGDAPLAFLLGFFLGFPNILVGLLSAFFSGSLVGLLLIFLGRKTLKSAVPFGPFLIFGAFLALFLGEQIIRLYLNFLVI